MNPTPTATTAIPDQRTPATVPTDLLAVDVTPTTELLVAATVDRSHTRGMLRLHVLDHGRPLAVDLLVESPEALAHLTTAVGQLARQMTTSQDRADREARDRRLAAARGQTDPHVCTRCGGPRVVDDAAVGWCTACLEAPRAVIAGLTS